MTFKEIQELIKLLAKTELSEGAQSYLKAHIGFSGPQVDRQGDMDPDVTLA